MKPRDAPGPLFLDANFVAIKGNISPGSIFLCEIEPGLPRWHLDIATTMLHINVAYFDATTTVQH